MTYARAGHTPLHLPAGRQRRRAAAAQILAPDGLVLGLRIDDGERFERAARGGRRCRFVPGDLLVFFTDGISEAMNEHADCFGEARLAELVEEHGAPAVRRAARADPAGDRRVRRRRAAARRHDDDPAEGRRAPPRRRRSGEPPRMSAAVSTWSSSSARSRTSRPASCAACSRRTASRSMRVVGRAARRVPAHGRRPGRGAHRGRAATTPRPRRASSQDYRTSDERGRAGAHPRRVRGAPGGGSATASATAASSSTRSRTGRAPTRT